MNILERSRATNHKFNFYGKKFNNMSLKTNTPQLFLNMQTENRKFLSKINP